MPGDATRSPARWRRAPHTAWRTVGGETVVIDLRNKRMYGLNPAAAFLWYRVEADAPLLAAELALPADGVRAFFSQLAELELLDAGATPAEASSPSMSPLAKPEPPIAAEAPSIVWQEELQQVAGTCAFLPGTSAICDQVPFS